MSPRRTGVNALQTAINAQLGPVDLTRTLPTQQGWVVATWMVAHAKQFGITSVTFDGRRWTPTSATWATRSPAVSKVQIARLPAS